MKNYVRCPRNSPELHLDARGGGHLASSWLSNVGTVPLLRSRRYPARPDVLENSKSEAVEISGSVFLGPICFVEQQIYRSIDLRAARTDVADDPLRVDHEDGRERENVPPGADRAIPAAVPPAAPGNFPITDRFSEGLPLGIGVNAEHRERTTLEPQDQLALHGIHRPAGTTPVAGEGQHDDLTVIIAEPKSLAVDVLSLDVGSRPADSKVAQLEQRGIGQSAVGLGLGIA